MSLPLTAPPQLLAVDDVLGVEIIGDADQTFRDIREHLGVEHYAGSRTSDSAHRVVVVPKAIAILKLTDPDQWGDARFATVFSQGFAKAPTFSTGVAGIMFDFAAPSPWHGIEVSVRSSNPVHALGWGRWQDPSDASKGGVTFDRGWTVRDLTGITIAVFGDK